jgi:hypothetical protein
MAYINGYDLIRAIGESENRFSTEKDDYSIELQLNSVNPVKSDPNNVVKLVAKKELHPGLILPFAFRVDQLSNRNATTGVIHRGPFILPLKTDIGKPDRYTERDWILISGERDTSSLIPKNQLTYYDRSESMDRENTTLETVSYNRSFIIRVLIKYSNNHEFFKLLSRSAEKNRFVIWNGYLCCHIVYLSAKETIKPENELIFVNKQNETYPYLLDIQKRLPLFTNNSELLGFLLDIIPFFFDRGASGFALYYKTRKFSLKWQHKEIGMPRKETVEEMIQSVVSVARGPNKWIKLDSKEEMTDIVDLLNYIIHPFRRYINAEGYNRISKRLFQCSYIDCYATEQTIEKAYKYIYKEKLVYSEQATKSVLNLTENSNFDRKAWFSNDGYNFFLIPVLGESNVLYRDCLYFMTRMIYRDEKKTVEEREDDKENDKLKIESKEEQFALPQAIEKEKQLLASGESSLIQSLEFYDKMVVFHGEHKIRRLMLPLKVFVNSIVCMEFEDYYYDTVIGTRNQSYNIKDLKREFVYAYAFFTGSLKVSDFVKLIRIYARFYYILRLLPVPQLENKWVNTVFARYFNYFLLVCDLFIEKKDCLIVRDPLTKEKGLFLNNRSLFDTETTNYSLFKYREYKTRLQKDSENAKNITVASILEKLNLRKKEFPLVSCCVDFETDLNETIPQRLAPSDFLSLQLSKIRTQNEKNATQFPVFKSEAFIFKFMKFQDVKPGKDGQKRYDKNSGQAINECEAYKVIKAYNLEQYFPVVCDIVVMHQLPEEYAHSYKEIESKGAPNQFFVIKMELLDWILEARWPSLTPLEKVKYLLEIFDILDKTLLKHNDLFLRQVGSKRGRLVLLDLGTSDFDESDRDLAPSKKFLAYSDANFMITQIEAIQTYNLSEETKKEFKKAASPQRGTNKSTITFAFIRQLLNEMQSHFELKLI